MMIEMSRARWTGRCAVYDMRSYIVSYPVQLISIFWAIMQLSYKDHWNTSYAAIAESPAGWQGVASAWLATIGRHDQVLKTVAETMS